MSIQVTQEQAVSIFAALDIPAAAKWTPARLQAKLNKLDEMVDEDADFEPEVAKLAGDIMAELKEGGEVELAESNGAPAATKGKGKAAAKGKGKEEAPAGKKAAKKGKADGKKKEDKGPGVIASIVEFLKAASSKSPLTKDQLADKLAKRFPDRERESMLRTINVQVPNRLKTDKELDVKAKDGAEGEPKGYWIP